MPPKYPLDGRFWITAIAILAAGALYATGDRSQASLNTLMTFAGGLIATYVGAESWLKGKAASAAPQISPAEVGNHVLQVLKSRAAETKPASTVPSDFQHREPQPIPPQPRRFKPIRGCDQCGEPHPPEYECFSGNKTSSPDHSPFSVAADPPFDWKQVEQAGMGETLMRQAPGQFPADYHQSPQQRTA